MFYLRPSFNRLIQKRVLSSSSLFSLLNFVLVDNKISFQRKVIATVRMITNMTYYIDNYSRPISLFSLLDFVLVDNKISFQRKVIATVRMITNMTYYIDNYSRPMITDNHTFF